MGVTSLEVGPGWWGASSSAPTFSFPEDSMKQQETGERSEAGQGVSRG